MTRFEIEQVNTIKKAINEVLVELWLQDYKLSEDFSELTKKLIDLCEEAWNKQVKANA